MVIRLIKDYDSTKDSLYLAQQRDDLESIENELNGLSNSISKHKSAVTAHTSSQIAHGGGLTVYEEIEIAKARIRNLILNADGTNIKEVVDARVDDDGFVYPVLKERLDADKGEIKNQLAEMYRTVELITNSQDALSYLNNVEAMTTFKAREEALFWPQSANINELTNEIYVASQENEGTELRIEIRDLDTGSFKERKSIPIESGAYTEGLSFFYNDQDNLCFIVKASKRAGYNIFNYDTGELSDLIIANVSSKYAANKYYFASITVNQASIHAYVYTWESIKMGNPVLYTDFTVDYIPNLEKVQGITLNDGFLFMSHGKSNGRPAISVYNLGGELLNYYIYTKDSLASAINKKFSDFIPNIYNYNFENESCCVYKGDLVAVQVVNNADVVLVRHNRMLGYSLDVNVNQSRKDTGWMDIELLNGATAYVSERIPRIRRIGNKIRLEAELKGITTMDTEYISYYPEWSPDRVLPFTIPTSGGYNAVCQIQPNGKAKILSTRHPSPDVNSWYPIVFEWYLN
ncbi:hypothetical protein CJZ71_15770 [Bacillus subtilis]|uniref:hypothetical protein n=1 Tax=Bacillus subtilis group TaxID=653685 RepID=UPI0008533F98|nr:hypothetical protein [Bacillus subtilis]AOS66800.1 hypothetical protein A4A60_03580 [Bacillus subtilis]ARW30298.1 hypothetical protein S101441_00728 [Bacillus subtilis subsp. subtilis]ASB69881.1 hypothetical protein S100333_01988 [Bacillus subtilis subsp. subtilis]ASV03470.1 hypothetical protein CJZ71_15770 [Bacillus subtilis]AYK55901.1 hypothetical protein D9C10_01100 [Bacillus subtilis subsp. subtilis]